MATQIYPTFVRSAGESGAIREFWIKMEGLVGVSSSIVVNVIENPMQEDLVILETIINVTTQDAEDAGLDIGLGDDSTGENDQVQIASDISMTDTAGVYEPGVVHSIDTPPIKVVWKAPNATHDAVHSWIITYQGTSNDAADLVYNLLVKVIPYADLL